MSALQHILPLFRWCPPLGRAGYLGSSLTAALIFVFSLLIHIMALAVLGSGTDSGAFALLAWLILFPGTFVATATSPFVLLLTTIIMSIVSTCPVPLPDIPTWAAVLLALLTLVLLAGSFLRLIALAVRRRKDAGLSPINYFAFSLLYLALLFIIFIAELGGSPNILFIAFILCINAQCAMLFRSTKPLPPAA